MDWYIRSNIIGMCKISIRDLRLFNLNNAVSAFATWEKHFYGHQVSVSSLDSLFRYCLPDSLNRILLKREKQKTVDQYPDDVAKIQLNTLRC